MRSFKHFLRNLTAGAALSIGFLPSVHAFANLSGADMLDYTAYPVTTLENVTPQVMLAMSRDHQYFLKAYNDYTDLDDSGTVEQDETTYNNSFEYYGYFDPDKCYSYDRQNFPGGGFIEHFEPKAFAVNYYCDTVAGEWSGNFMNWATMTRMDIIRKMMYGGRRYEDRDSHTILERALLPTDAHSFAKYYNGDDIEKLTPFTGVKTDTTNGGDADGIDDQDEGITICNTTRPKNSGSSQTTTERPLARIVEGNFKLWAANERWQCRFDKNARNANNPAASGIFADDDEPNSGSDGLTNGGYGPDFELHILACVPGLISSNDDNENCKQYPDGNYKPRGLVQEYGEDGRIDFGMFTGTFDNHVKGGVLRKNIGGLDDEINPDDGTFKADPNSAVPAVGIMRTLDKFRIYGYDYQDGVYDKGDSCGFREKGLVDSRCFSWGNPMGEIYAEALRYFAGLTATTQFDANDNTFVGGLDEETWVDPLDDDNFCAGLNLIMINSSLNSFDHDQIDVFDAVGNGNTAESLTKTVGDLEGITGNDYFVGEIDGVASDELCTAKTVNDLGKVRGQCPEGPTQKGTYNIAGMAHYAATEDIRPLLQGDQRVTTYAVQLSTDVPRIRVPVDADNEITIIPAIQLSNCAGGCNPTTGTKAAGTLIDFQIVQVHTETAPGSGIFTGRFYSNHEVSEAGGDYDQDLWGTISYTLNTNVSPATISITTDLHAQSSSAGVLYGFVLSGTTQDGFHAYTGMNSAVFNDPDVTILDCSSEVGDNNCDTGDGPATHTFTAGSGAGAQFLPDPLFLAAKYGGFVDSNGNGIPDLDGEWDVRDTSGNRVPGGDGIPDTFFFVTNPAALEDALRSVFDQVIERVASGTAAAVVASEQEGTGAVFQALYDPIKTDVLGNEATWMGTLHAVFVDPNGFLREDTNDNDQLDNYQTDKVIEIFFDEDARRARLRRFDSSDAAEFVDDGNTEAELETLNPIWNARRQLSSVSDVITQRTYTNTADTGRYIFTWLDTDYDGLVKTDGTEQFDFTTTTFDDNNFGWLDFYDGVTLNDDEADKLVNFIRGEDQAGYRTRVVDYDKDGAAETQRLGDIVNSTPTVMGTPAEAFDILSLDNSYAAFRAQYVNRRNVVFVGANDGMIHAINGGFFDVTTSEFKTALNVGDIAHPLGSELWAYIPKNLLGHLQWLADEDYTHVYYSDLKPFLFDAKIFDPNDADHPNGWGTVLVVGMRLGGGHDGNGILLDTQADGYGVANADNDDSDDVQTKSAYVLLDVTNPEEAPTVIAELSPPDQYFTTSFPAVALIGAPDPTGELNPPNEWYLIFGSGPTDLGDVESNQTAKLFAYDLRELVLGNDGVVEDGPFDDGIANNGIGFYDTNDADTFVGEITISDQDLDMKAEAVYFGTVGLRDGTGGNLYRMTLDEDEAPSNWETPFELLAVDKPFTARPSITIDEQFRTWIIAGTGRLWANDDKNSTGIQTLYGAIDQYSIPGNPLVDFNNPTTLDYPNFIDVTDAVTFADGQVDLDGDGNLDTTYDAVSADVSSAGGWFHNYDSDFPLFVEPSERTVSNSTLIGGIVLSTAFTPSTDQCGAEGESRIIGRAFDSGLVPPLGIFGQVCNGCPDGNAEAVGSVSLGAGLASSPSIHIGNQDVPGKVTVIVQQSTGAITGNQAQTMGGLNNGEVSWQEFRFE